MAMGSDIQRKQPGGTFLDAPCIPGKADAVADARNVAAESRTSSHTDHEAWGTEMLLATHQPINRSAGAMRPRCMCRFRAKISHASQDAYTQKPEA